MNILTYFTGCIISLVLLAGCSSIPRNAVPESLTDESKLISLENVRFYGDAPPEDARQVVRKKVDQSIAGRPDEWNEDRIIDVNLLIITGGGADGAYGAGLLNGMTDGKNRLDFEVVTGVSTGALIAPFAFLGPEYDSVIKDLYTKSSTKDIIQQKSALVGLFSNALSSSKPLQELIARNITMEFMEKVAHEYKIGRRLFVGTTNLDAQRPVIWNMGEIATHNNTAALELFRKVLLASASIPAAFPSVKFEVEANGKMFEELHVDGGVTNNAFFLPIRVGLGEYLKELGLRVRPTMYVLRNSSSEPAWNPVENKTLTIAKRSIDTLVKSATTGDLHKLYTFTQINGIGFRVTSVPSSFKQKSTELFDPLYMGKLYDLGYSIGLNGVTWDTTPPGL